MSDIHIYIEREQPVKVITLEPVGARGPIGPQGPAGEPGPAGPNSVTSATTSDGTANLDILTLTIEDDNGAINVTGLDSSIGVSGLNGTISATGENGSIFVDGANASIRTANGGYFETTSTYRINTGGFTTTLSGTQTVDRAIAFPDASGTLALTSQLGITLTGDVTGSGTGSITTTIANGAVTLAKLADIGHEKLIGRHATGAGVPQEVGIDGGLEFNGGNIRRAALTGDVTASAGSNTTTLATVNANVGSFGSATQAVSLTVNAKGLVTAASASTITPAVGSITGLGTGVATALAVSANGSGGFITDTGTVTLTNKTLTNPTVNNYTEGVVAIGTVTSSHTFSLTNGTFQTATLTASTACTFTMPTAAAGKSFILHLKQAASTGNGTATFTGVKWAGGTAPTVTATAGRMDIFTFTSDGTNWYGSTTQNFTP